MRIIPQTVFLLVRSRGGVGCTDFPAGETAHIPKSSHAGDHWCR